MALIAAFRGLRYCKALAGSMGRLVGPPYDPVTEQDLDRYRSRHKRNITCLLYGRDESRNRPQGTALTLRQWVGREDLVRDKRPAIYLYQIDYRMEESGPTLTRTGFMALLRLQDYDMGMIRPHERTFSAIKEEKLEALNACQANLSQVFTFYDDPGLEVTEVLAQGAPSRPDLEFRDPEGITHRLWLVTDPQAHLQAARLMAPKSIYIADGHHRYETCLAHRRRMRHSFPTADPRSPFNYTLVYASALQDPGLAILPAHRLITELPGFDRGEFLSRADRFFRIVDTGLDPLAPEAPAGFKKLLEGRPEGETALGFLAAGAPTFILLTLKEEIRSPPPNTSGAEGGGCGHPQGGGLPPLPGVDQGGPGRRGAVPLRLRVVLSRGQGQGRPGRGRIFPQPDPGFPGQGGGRRRSGHAPQVDLFLSQGDHRAGHESPGPRRTGGRSLKGLTAHAKTTQALVRAGRTAGRPKPRGGDSPGPISAADRFHKSSEMHLFRP